MTNQEIFKNCIYTISEINHIINTFDKLGLNTDDTSFDGALYESMNGAIDIAMDVIGINDSDASEYNSVINEVMGCTRENKDEVIKWVLEEHYHEHGQDS